MLPDGDAAKKSITKRQAYGGGFNYDAQFQVVYGNSEENKSLGRA